MPGLHALQVFNSKLPHLCWDVLFLVLVLLCFALIWKSITQWQKIVNLSTCHLDEVSRLRPWQRQCFGSLCVMPTASGSIAEVPPAHLTHVKTPTLLFPASEPTRPAVRCTWLWDLCHCFISRHDFVSHEGTQRLGVLVYRQAFCCPHLPEVQILSASCLCGTCLDLNYFLLVTCLSLDQILPSVSKLFW